MDPPKTEVEYYEIGSEFDYFVKVADDDDSKTNKTKEIFPCDKCGKFKTSRIGCLIIHILIAHRDSLDRLFRRVNRRRQYFCAECNLMFTAYLYKRHLKCFHARVYPLRCKSCNIVCADCDAYCKHMDNAHAPFYCKQCSFKVATWRELNEHYSKDGCGIKLIK